VSSASVRECELYFDIGADAKLIVDNCLKCCDSLNQLLMLTINYTGLDLTSVPAGSARRSSPVGAFLSGELSMGPSGMLNGRSLLFTSTRAPNRYKP
jgi:hypothetical protein